MSQLFCPNCGEAYLPVEPLWPLDYAAMLLLTNVPNLVNTLSRHKAKMSPPTYRWVNRQRRRFVTAHDIRVVRDILYSQVRFTDKSLKKKIIQDAMREQRQHPLAAPPVP